MKIKTAILKKRRFSANLPEDFRALKSIKKSDGRQLPSDPFMALSYIDNLGRFHQESFYVREDVICFSGDYSKYWIVRIWQNMVELLLPETYEIEYMSLKSKI